MMPLRVLVRCRYATRHADARTLARQRERARKHYELSG